MNRAYKLVWNAVSHSWVVASELAKGRKKSSSTALKLAVLVAAGIGAGMANAAPAANALPSGESIASGSATFDRTVSNQLTVNQSTSKLITNWNSFDVGSGATVQFAQPDASSIALNRVTSGSASEIFGQVTANGQLVIVNPNGITFGAGSQVSAASIIGSVLDINDSDFNAGTLLFSRGSATGTIDNHGSLTGTAGSVSLLAPTVKNSGTITATGGNAALINADAVNLTAADPSVTTASSITGLIQQSGNITATQVSSVGGKILLTGDTSQSTSQIQLAGALQADTTSVNGRSILVNGDVNLNGASNVLALTSTAGYSLSNGAKVNLNGASSGFSVNGTAYTVIRDVNQLQAISSALSGRYVLALNIDASDTVNWNAGAGFVPLGTGTSSVTTFTGVLDGLGHAVSGLTINRPTTNYVGLIGSTGGSVVRNIGIVGGSISGRNYVGGLIGANGNTGSAASTVSNSYSTANITGAASSTFVGGLLGVNQAAAFLTNSYASGNVTVGTGSNYTGGLAGVNQSGGIITNSYATGNVSGANYVGGLLGVNYGSSTVAATTTNTYSSGSVTGTANVGGLIGWNNYSNVTNSFWNIDSSGQSVGIKNIVNGTLTNVTGLTMAQSKQLSSYSSWGADIDAQAGTGSVWRIYDGMSAPLLRSFLKPLSSVVVDSATKTYDGTVFSGVTFTATPGTDTSQLFGGVVGGRNAGTYTLDAYSLQQGYDFNATTGTLTINKASLVISSTDASKTYDGTTSVSGVNAVVAGGTQLFSTDSISGGSFEFANKNAGSGKSVIVSAVTVDDGNNGGNYDVTYADNTTSTIDKATLSISATDASKVYDGTTTASSSAFVVAGNLIGTDSLNGATFNYADKHAGSGKHVIVSAAQISDGNNGGNYDVTYVDNTNSSISKRLLTISAVADSKEYDGKLGASATAKPTTIGRQRGDSIVGLTQSYLDRNVGTDKAINVDAGYTIRDGNGGNNYDVVIVNSNAGVITPKALTISTVANSKVYDGGLTSANKPLVTGLVAGDRVTGLFQQYETKTVGENKKLLIKSGYVVQDGNGGSNYTVAQQTTNDGVITAH